MKRLMTLAAICAVGLIAPATVGAAAKEYNGTFESGGSLQFKVKTSNNGKQKVIDFAFQAFPVQCEESGANSASGILTFRIKVENNKFEANAVSTTPGAEAKLTLTGKLKGGGKAEGTMKIQGDNVLVDTPPGERHDCTSPKTDWTAES